VPVPPVPASSANIIYGLIGFLTLILLLRSTVLTRIRAASLASKKAKSPYFTAHLQKAQYEELAEMYSPEDEHGLKILTSALVRRAMVDVQRIWQIREEKPSLQGLVRTGVLGEDMMEKITEAEKELEVEVQELITEADMYKPGWGKTIFQEATTFMQAQAQQLQQAAQQQQQRGCPGYFPGCCDVTYFECFEPCWGVDEGGVGGTCEEGLRRICWRRRRRRK
ncbi:Pre protein translocase subunit Sec66-domain-containing protein, partial [Chytridium lagenaria]